MNPQYRFECHGKIKTGFSESGAAQNLAKLFGVSPSEFSAFFKGDESFIREPLDKTTAEQYQEKFDRIGLIGYSSPLREDERISRDSKIDTPSNTNLVRDAIHQKPCCPKCNSPDIDEEQCHNCGIYIKKFLAMQKPAEKNHSHAINGDLIHELDHDEERKLAIKWLTISTVAISSVFTAGELLSRIATPTSAGIDIGSIPILLAHLILIYGCVLYASSKGYSAAFGLLGVFSFAGLSILLVLPDKVEKYNSSSIKQWLFAALCIGSSGYWFIGMLGQQQSTSEFTSSASILADGRHLPPSATLNTEEFFKAEHDELIQYLDESLKNLTQKEYNKNNASAIANTLMQSIVDYRRWQYYQSYLNGKHDKTQPHFLSHKALRKESLEIIKLLESHIDFKGQNSPTSRAILSWFWGADFPGETGHKIWMPFYNHIMETIRTVRIEHADRAYKANQENGSVELDLTQLDLPQDPRFPMKIGDDSIRFEIKSPKIEKKYITILFYEAIPQRVSSRTHASTELFYSSIDSNIPPQYLRSPYNGLAEFDPPGTN